MCWTAAKVTIICTAITVMTCSKAEKAMTVFTAAKEPIRWKAMRATTT